jgi:uncharacterized SAM-binding protein YcdF (DUF218 family)
VTDQSTPENNKPAPFQYPLKTDHNAQNGVFCFLHSRTAFALCVFSICALVYYTALCLYGSTLLGFSLFWLFAAAAGVLFAFVAEKRKRRGKNLFPGRKSRVLFAVLAFCLTAACTAALVFILHPRPADPEGDFPCLIVLGAGIRTDGSVTAALAGRLNTATAYLSSHPATMVIVSGGHGRFTPFPESRAMAAYLRDRGISRERIIEEENSLDTIQNLRFSGRILRERTGGNISAAILTSDFHLSRALFLAKRMGYTSFKGISSPSPYLLRPNLYAREIFATVKLCLRLILAPETLEP